MSQDAETVKNGGESPQIGSTPLIAVGSNRSFGGYDPTSLVPRAISLVSKRLGVIRKRSGLFRTPAFPPGAGPEFVNAVFSVDTKASASSILKVLHAVEEEFGRQREKRWGARTMDLDLIAVGSEVLPDPVRQRHWLELPLTAQRTQVPDELILPHPRLQERAFVLIPLAEVAPDWVHPVLGKSVPEMVRNLPDKVKEEVRRL